MGLSWIDLPVLLLPYKVCYFLKSVNKHDHDGKVLDWPAVYLICIILKIPEYVMGKHYNIVVYEHMSPQPFRRSLVKPTWLDLFKRRLENF